MQQTLSIQRTQWLVIGLLALPELYTIVYNAFRLIAGDSIFPPTEGYFLLFRSGITLTFAFIVLVGYILLSNVAANRATSLVTKIYAIVSFVLSFIGIAFFIIKQDMKISNVLASLETLLTGLVRVGYFLYWLGVVERNNMECKQTQLMLRVWFFITLFFVLVPQLFPLLLPGMMLPAILLTNILSGISYIAVYYLLFTSEAFSGVTDTAPAPKGAYKFWNRYFTIYLVFSILVGIICGVLDKLVL